MHTPLSPLTGRHAEDDSEQMIKLLELEIINRRAKRLAQGGDNNRQAVRTLGIFALFMILMAALGMTWYMQTSRPASRPAAVQQAAPSADAPR